MKIGLEQRLKKTKGKIKEYSRVIGATEGGAIIGNQVGIHGSSSLTDITLFKTGGTLSGDYIGGTIGQHFSYWYNNREKFRDENGKFKYLEFFKDNLKITLYDLPVTSFTYVCSGNITYQLIKHDVDETIVGLVNWLATMIIWNLINYHVYDAIKHNKDEKLAVKIYKKIKKSK